MIGRLAGILLEKLPPEILVDAGRVGYEVSVPMSTFYELPPSGDNPNAVATASTIDDLPETCSPKRKDTPAPRSRPSSSTHATAGIEAG